MPAPDENESDRNEHELDKNVVDEDEAGPSPIAPLESDDVSAPFYTTNSRQAAWLLIVGGVVLALVLILRGPRKLLAWAVPLGLIGAGIAILAQHRQARLNAVAEQILADLDGLDLVAKAQVLFAVAREVLPGLR